MSPPPPPFSTDFLANPEFRAMVRSELSDILADFITTQEKRASDVSLIERIIRVEEAQRSHEQLTRALLEQINLRFEEIQRNMDKRFDATDKRFEVMQQTMDKRFEAMDKRFDSMDKRFEAMQQTMDNRFEAMDKRFEAMQQTMDKRFEAMQQIMDKRFEGMQQAMDNRFKELGRRLDRFMFWSLGLTVSATFLIITMLR
jgi:DNA anti-recombination protein RmuC